MTERCGRASGSSLRWSWVLLLALTATPGCAHRGTSGHAVTRADSAPAVYPLWFIHPPAVPTGVGFSLPGQVTRGPAYTQAVEMAGRMLAWSTHVRVRGERLYWRTPDGRLESGGQKVELLELPELAPDICQLDTLNIDRYTWVVAHGRGSVIPVPAAVASFTPSAPAWIAVTPREPGWHHALGIATLASRDEPGSWELATYRALVELAIGVGARSGDLEKTLTGEQAGAGRLVFDTRIQGFHVAARWRDAHNVFVLARVRADRARTMLETSDDG